jgi:hypothetical protein
MTHIGPASLWRRFVRRVTGRDTHDRLAALEQRVASVHQSHGQDAAELGSRLSRLTDAVLQQPTGKDVRELRQAVRQVAVTVERSIPRLGGSRGAQADERRVRKQLDRLASSSGPMVIGPWSGEVGFELLYWIPFVEWVRSQWDLTARPQLVVSRGGVASWYRVEQGQYEDIFTHCSPEEFRSAVAAERRKQRRSGEFDHRLVEAVTASRQLGEVAVLHPGLMYRLFEPYWSDDAGYARIDQFTRYRLLGADIPLDVDLPSEYVAVRFYFSECFPDTPENRAFARAVVDALAERTAVVLLNPGFQVDDHADWASHRSPRVITIADRLTPASNLAVQSAVIARARALVGSYGGYSYLAPLLGVPAVGFYSRPTFKLHHLHAAQRAFERVGAASLTCAETAQLPLLQSAIGVAIAGR